MMTQVGDCVLAVLAAVAVLPASSPSSLSHLQAATVSNTALRCNHAYTSASAAAAATPRAPARQHAALSTAAIHCTATKLMAACAHPHSSSQLLTPPCCAPCCSAGVILCGARVSSHGGGVRQLVVQQGMLAAAWVVLCCCSRLCEGE